MESEVRAWQPAALGPNVTCHEVRAWQPTALGPNVTCCCVGLDGSVFLKMRDSWPIFKNQELSQQHLASVEFGLTALGPHVSIATESGERRSSCPLRTGQSPASPLPTR